MKVRKILLAAPLLFLAGASFAGDKELVKYRENGMEVIGGHMGSIVAIVKGEVPYSYDLVYHAEGLAAAAPRVIPAFETKAMTDKSEALPKIWDEWDDFEAGAKKLEDTAAALAVAAQGGDMGVIGAALGDVGKACKACHDDYMKEH
jgi:cytochrome c556